MTGQDWMEKDFYRTLGVSKDADAATIKKAYRKLARKHHPDQNKGDARAEERFKQIGEAYQVLSDPKQRQQYDAIRAMAGGGARFQAGPGGAGAGSQGFEDILSGLFGGGGNVRFQETPFGGYAGGSATQGFGFDDVLSGLFTGGGFGGRGSGGPSAGNGFPFGGGGANRTQTNQQPTRGRDLAARCSLTFAQALKGATIKMTVEGRKMTVRIPAGVSDGQKLKLRGKGRPGENGGENGDLTVTITVAAHPVYRIENGNLHMRLPISPDEAIIGANVPVPTWDGDHVTVKIPAGTSTGAQLRVKKHGVEKNGVRGDLILDVVIVVPEKPTREQRHAAAAFADSGAFDPRDQWQVDLQDSDK